MEQNVQQMWDLKASDFYSDQKNHQSEMTGNVIKSLEKHSVLPCKKLLDVGGGSGRYAVPMAAYADSVTVTDISSKMLEYAAEYAKESEIARGRLDYVQLDWQTADLQTLGWLHEFDLAFASMSPAVKTEEGLGKMMEASRGWCCIAQFIDSTDSVEMEIATRTKSDLAASPHRDREFVDRLFRSLWKDGFNPWVEYLEEELDQTLTVEEARLRYERRYGPVLRTREMSLDPVLASLSHEGRIKVSGKTTMALILWKV